MKFLSLVESLVEKESRGPSNWYTRLDTDARKELDEIKARFKAGRYKTASKRAIARAVIAAAKERGWIVCGETGVREWLARD